MISWIKPCGNEDGSSSNTACAVSSFIGLDAEQTEEIWGMQTFMENYGNQGAEHPNFHDHPEECPSTPVTWTYSAVLKIDAAMMPIA